MWVIKLGGNGNSWHSDKVRVKHPSSSGDSLVWTFGWSNQKTVICINAVNASLCVVLVQLSWVICKAAEQEMRLERCSHQSLQDEPEGVALQVVPPRQTVVGSSVQAGLEDRIRVHKVLVMDKDFIVPKMYYLYKHRCAKIKWWKRPCLVLMFCEDHMWHFKFIVLFGIQIFFGSFFSVLFALILWTILLYSCWVKHMALLSLCVISRASLFSL